MAKSGWIPVVGVLAALWNTVGIYNFLADVGIVPGGPPPGGTVMPPLITAAFGIGVFTGLAGSIALALRSRLARPLLWISLVTTAIDFGWVFRFSDNVSVPLGVTVLVIATLLALLAEREARRGVATP